ncbi:hypothetical protein SCOR_35225 [Sulfidibacter corallicola]
MPRSGVPMVGLPNHRNTGLRHTDHWVSDRNLIETNHLGVLTSTIGASPQLVWHGRYGTAGMAWPVPKRLLPLVRRSLVFCSCPALIASKRRASGHTGPARSTAVPLSAFGNPAKTPVVEPGGGRFALFGNGQALPRYLPVSTGPISIAPERDASTLGGSTRCPGFFGSRTRAVTTAACTPPRTRIGSLPFPASPP